MSVCCYIDIHKHIVHCTTRLSLQDSLALCIPQILESTNDLRTSIINNNIGHKHVSTSSSSSNTTVSSNGSSNSNSNSSNRSDKKRMVSINGKLDDFNHVAGMWRIDGSSVVIDTGYKIAVYKKVRFIFQ